jgi:hypothetical protein
MAEGTNGYDPDAIKRWSNEILKHHDTIASYKGEHARRCQTVQQMISDCYDRAKDEGLPKRALKKIIKRIQLENKILDLDDGGDDGEPDEAYQNMIDCVKADLPLFVAGYGAEVQEKPAKAKGSDLSAFQ